MSMQIQAQLYIVHTYMEEPISDGVYSGRMTTSAPDGTTSTIELPPLNITFGTLAYIAPEELEPYMQAINTELNNIINQGYKLIHATTESGLGSLSFHTFYLSVPWTTVGLTGINSSEINLRISPNPANDYINVEVDFTSQPSELVLISEQGYIYFKKDMSNILSGQEFTLDISNVPAGKYLITVKDSKQYLTPKKLIVF